MYFCLLCEIWFSFEFLDAISKSYNFNLVQHTLSLSFFKIHTRFQNCYLWFLEAVEFYVHQQHWKTKFNRKRIFIINFKRRCLWWIDRSSHRRCSIKNVFLKISQNSQGNICARVSSFLTKLQAMYLRTSFLQNTYGRLLLYRNIGNTITMGHK